jgi:cytochrome c-type biogenesis protein CcmH
MKCIYVFWMGLCIGLANAGEASPMAEDPVVEARLAHISQEIRCLVCQNESLSSSRAELADDLRREVRDLIRTNKSDQEIKDFLVSRYGDFVLYGPEVKPLTWVLWFCALVVFMLVYLRQRRATVKPQVLSDAERARVEQLMKD